MARQRKQQRDASGTERLPAGPEILSGAPRIWAVAGGKGGVGKSVIATNLAVAIAASGRRTTLIDADLGAANLHTLLGTSRPPRSLSHFLGGEVKALAELMVPTSIPQLSLISGNEALIDIANPKHCQKEKLFRHVRGLDVDEVVLDLGAGSTFNVLDAFLIAQRGLLVVTPEPTAIENAEHFLRAAFYRSLRGVTRRPEVRAAILRVKENRSARPPGSARELIARVKPIDPIAAKLLEECAESFAPLLLVNQVETREQQRVGPDLAARCRERLDATIEHAGSLDFDPQVRQSVAQGRPMLQLFARGTFSRQIEALAAQLLRDDWEAPRIAEPRAAPTTRVRSRRPAPDTPRAAQPEAPLPSLDLDHPGDYLRRCREQQRKSLGEMIERTRIQSLADIEGENFATLPPEPYLKGFVLEYARELGVVELQALAASYLERYRREASTRTPG